MENSVIKTSLKAIKAKQRDETSQLLNSFALIREDTACPLDVLGVMFAALGQARGETKSRMTHIPPRLLLRKWLKVLIDRSLVLGTVDRPQLYVAHLTMAVAVANLFFFLFFPFILFLSFVFAYYGLK